MSLRLKIAQGVSAHSEWKQRLIEAINTGQSKWSPEVVCKDDQCEFGKWLYSCSAQERSSPHYVTVKSLHAEFHKEAAEVLKYALDNKKQLALDAMKTGSKYLTISTKLTQGMMVWSKEA